MNDWASLPFEERQRQWNGGPRHFRQHHGRGDRPTVWEIFVQGDRVFTRHGLLGGAMQETSYQGKAKNIGRANAISAEQDAMAEARRDCRKRYDFEGYDEYGEGISGSGQWTNIDRRSQDISIQHLLTNLPGSFCLYKPENNFWDQKKLLEKARAGKAWYTLKRDGMAKLVVVDYYGQVHIYSRRARPHHDKEGPKELPDGTLDPSTIIPWRRRFPVLTEAVKRLGLPPGSMLAGELVFPRHGRDEFKFISSITKSLTPKAIEDMAAKGYPALYVWDMPFFAGQDLISKETYALRQKVFREIWDKSIQSGDGHDPQIWLVPTIIEQFPDPETAIARAKELGIEGWVVVDPEASYGDKGWNLKGKPDRPSLCAKLKPKQEDDFVAFWDPDQKRGEWGTGRHERGKVVTLPDKTQVEHGGLGSVALFQYNSKNELVYICDCSSGLDYALQSRLRKEHFPQVWKIEYDSRTYISDGEKTNALRFPTFLSSRTDKRPEECINDAL